MSDLGSLREEINLLRSTVYLQEMRIRAMQEQMGRYLSARAILVDGTRLAELRGLVSGEKASVPAMREKVVCLYCGEDGGVPIMDANGLKGPLAVAYFEEEGDASGAGKMFPRAAK